MAVWSFCVNVFSGVNWEAELKVLLSIRGINWKLNLSYLLVEAGSFHGSILNKLCEAVQYYVSYVMDGETEAQSCGVSYLSNAVGNVDRTWSSRQCCLMCYWLLCAAPCLAGEPSLSKGRGFVSSLRKEMDLNVKGWESHCLPFYGSEHVILLCLPNKWNYKGNGSFGKKPQHCNPEHLFSTVFFPLVSFYNLHPKHEVTEFGRLGSVQ